MFDIRKANLEDSKTIKTLMKLSIEGIMGKILTDSELEASKESMGLDTQLIEDGTYFLVFKKDELVGSGGFSIRRTLFGGNHTPNRSNDLLSPKKEAAKIRAMYTHPDWVRKGVGSLILDLAEEQSKKLGFDEVELMATVSGILLYEKKGYVLEKEVEYVSKIGNRVPMYKMKKRFND